MSGYVMIPAWLLKRRLSANAILIYATLATYGTFNTAAGVYEECRPPIARIAEDSGTSDSTVKRALSELIEAGAIERTERWAEDGKTRLPSVYRVVFGSISGPSGFTGEPTPQSTGEPRVGSPVTHNPEPSTQNPPTQKKEPSASPRGTRLPEDWKPTEELIAWARDNAPGVGWSEHEKFVDYWRAIPGAKGVKLDWAATWRNWMRRASEQRSARPVSGPPSGRYLSAQEQNLQRAKIRKLRAKIADALMDQQGLDVDAAVAAAGPMAEDFVLNGVVPSIGTGYIEAEVIDTNGRPEVTE